MRKCLYGLLSVLIVVSCAYKPPADPNARPGKGLNFFPEWYDNMIGEQYGEMYTHELPVLRNAPVQRGVEDLGAHLVRAYYGSQVPPFHFEFHVVNLDVMNAFALPGGHIFVFRGLLQNLESEAELAGVLSHEMGHVVARHGTKNMSKGILYTGILAGAAGILAGTDHEDLAAATYIGGSIAISLGLLKYGRDHEREADWIAVHNCYRAGYNPEGMISLFEHFKDAEGKTKRPALMFLSSHPGPEERQQNVRRELPKLDMAQNWSQDQFGFSTALAEVKSLPPAPKELDAKPVMGLTSLDSLANAIAGSRTRKLKNEYSKTGTQTVSIYVPSNEEWTDTLIDLKAGQTLKLKVEPRFLSAGTGKPVGSIRKGESELQTFTADGSQTISVDYAGRLYLGISDDSYSDNEGWYVVNTEISDF
jgi:predicted Zn-dependent protease